MTDVQVIGEGSFGCVHKPSLKCDTPLISYKNKVSKVMNRQAAIDELKEYTLISKIDTNNQLYVGMPIKCNIKRSASSIKAIKKCKNITKKYLNNNVTKATLKKMSIIVMNYGGTNLNDFSKKLKNRTFNPKNVNMINRFWIETHRLFRGLVVFNKNNIVHHDVKPHNIVYNETEGRINYIDFGHMINMEKQIILSQMSNSWLYNYAFWNYPFETQFLNKTEYFEFTSHNTETRKTFLNYFVQDLKHTNSTKFATAYNIIMEYLCYTKTPTEAIHTKNVYLNDFYKMIKKMSLENYDIFLKRSVESIDVYGVGLSLHLILMTSRHLMPPHIVEKMEHCFYKMTTANLFERYTCMEAITEYENILMEYFSNVSFENHEIHLS